MEAAWRRRGGGVGRHGGFVDAALRRRYGDVGVAWSGVMAAWRPGRREAEWRRHGG